MADSPELPEAKDPFEKKIAISIAIIAVLLSYISMKGDNAKTDAIIKTNEAANAWGYFQAKSIKGSLVKMESDLLAASSGDTTKKREELRSESERYDKEKEEIKKKAEELQAEAKVQSDMNDRCALSALFLQVAVVICSVAILSRLHLFWYSGLALAAVGVVKFFF